MTNEQIEEMMKELFSSVWGIDVSIRGGYISIEIEDNDAIDVSFDDLSELSDLFETKNINVGDNWSSGGCETCGWGETHGLTIHINDCGVDLGGCRSFVMKQRRKDDSPWGVLVWHTEYKLNN